MIIDNNEFIKYDKNTKSNGKLKRYIALHEKYLKELDIISMVNSRHQNFYEDNLPPEVIQRTSQKIKQFSHRIRAIFQI